MFCHDFGVVLHICPLLFPRKIERCMGFDHKIKYYSRNKKEDKECKVVSIYSIFIGAFNAKVVILSYIHNSQTSSFIIIDIFTSFVVAKELSS